MITESSEVPRFCGISGAHRAYPAAGGLGILVGDRQLPHPGVESIVESYYRFLIGPWQLTADYQFIVNPAHRESRVQSTADRRPSCPREYARSSSWSCGSSRVQIGYFANCFGALV